MKGCDECLVAINYYACHEIGKVCLDENRDEINQEIKCLTEKEFNEHQMTSSTHANQCITDFHHYHLFQDEDFPAVPAQHPCPSESIWSVSLILKFESQVQQAHHIFVPVYVAVRYMKRIKFGP